jgi:hypothetical protein
MYNFSIVYLPETHFMTPLSQTDAALTPAELVTDEILERLETGGSERLLGEISAEDQSTLAMLLPDMCQELRALRRITQALTRA